MHLPLLRVLLRHLSQEGAVDRGAIYREYGSSLVAGCRRLRGVVGEAVHFGCRLMTLVLDAGGLSALAGQRARLAELRRRGGWPAQVPAVVLAEALTGDHRRDFRTNRLLRACQVRDVTEPLAREGARLRAATGRAGTITATDAVVTAFASSCSDPTVLTSDPGDLAALAEHTTRPVTISGV